MKKDVALIALGVASVLMYQKYGNDVKSNMKSMYKNIADKTEDKLESMM